MNLRIRELRKTVALLSVQLNDETVELDIDYRLFNQRLDCPKSSASLC